jgi:hypothetical protein
MYEGNEVMRQRDASVCTFVCTHWLKWADMGMDSVAEQSLRDFAQDIQATCSKAWASAGLC